MQEICFFEREYYMLSNWSAHVIDYKDRRYMTVDHAYHSAKFSDPKIIAEIIAAKSPMEAKNVAKKYKEKQKPDFDKIKVKVMKELNIEKARQHKEVQDALRKSKNLEIVEDSPYDDFWGTGADGKGENILGKIWMEIREKLFEIS